MIGIIQIEMQHIAALSGDGRRASYDDRIGALQRHAAKGHTGEHTRRMMDLLYDKKTHAELMIAMMPDSQVFFFFMKLGWLPILCRMRLHC